MKLKTAAKINLYLEVLCMLLWLPLRLLYLGIKWIDEKVDLGIYHMGQFLFEKSDEYGTEIQNDNVLSMSTAYSAYKLLKAEKSRKKRQEENGKREEI